MNKKRALCIFSTLGLGVIVYNTFAIPTSAKNCKYLETNIKTKIKICNADADQESRFQKSINALMPILGYLSESTILPTQLTKTYSELFCKNFSATPKTWNRMKNDFHEMRSQLETGMTFYFNTVKGCKTANALAAPNGNKIELCNNYNALQVLPKKEQEVKHTKFHTIAHELVHTALGLHDRYYGYKKCTIKANACKDDKKYDSTMKNPDCISYFIQSAYILKSQDSTENITNANVLEHTSDATGQHLPLEDNFQHV